MATNTTTTGNLLACRDFDERTYTEFYFEGKCRISG
jgi:hypothetical protein